MKSSTLLIVLSVIVAGGLVVFAAMKSGSGPSPYDSFAQCLTEKGAKMYGAWWCPHCKSQKDLFGSAFDSVDYVECSDASKNMSQKCKDAGITGYPTWKFADGTAVSGEQTLESLGEKTGCEVMPEEVTEETSGAEANAN